MSFGGFRPWTGKSAFNKKPGKILGKPIVSPEKQGGKRAGNPGRVTESNQKKEERPSRKPGAAKPGAAPEEPRARPTPIRETRKKIQSEIQAPRTILRPKTSSTSATVEVIQPRTPMRPTRTASRSVPKGGPTTPAPLTVQQAWDKRKELWSSINGVVMSAVLSIHNRSLLFQRALLGYLWQSMPAEKWEILLIDDMSTEDLEATYKPYIGKINFRHIKVDHRKFPLWAKKNPAWEPGKKENWYHTPALTINLGAYLSRGPVVCLCHPEILHAPENFERAAVRILVEEDVYLFGTTYLGTQADNQTISGMGDWRDKGWVGFQGDLKVDALPKYTEECYWYTSFLPRGAFQKIGGVDFEYLKGVAGEDDDFRERARQAGYLPIHAPELAGFHQDHSHEQERHRRRDTPDWYIGLETNRATYYRRKAKGFPRVANSSEDWAAQSCFVEEKRYSIGSSTPEIYTSL